MKSPIIEAYDAYQDQLVEFAQAIKSQVRAHASLKAVQAALGITAAMYYQRLRYPQNIPVQEVEALTNLVGNDLIKKAYNATIEHGQRLVESIVEGIKAADISVNFLCRKLQTDASNFYRKQKDPRLWTKAEIDRIAQVVTTIQNL